MSDMQFSPVCFGKIPAFGDFVRYNAASKDVEALDQWLQEGLFFAKNRLHPNWDLAYKKASAYHFIFPSNENARSLIGLFSPSWDKIGRKYPFLVALSIDNAFIHSNQPGLAPLIFSPFMEKAGLFITEAIQGQITQNIPATVEGLGSTLDQLPGNTFNLYDGYKNNTSLSEYFNRLFGPFDREKKYQVFHNLVDLLKPLKGYDVRQLNYGLRFPLGTDSQFRIYEVAFWLEIVYKFLPAYSGIPHIFYSSYNAINHYYLFLFFRSPSPNNFVNLMQVNLDNDLIYKLDDVASDPGNFENKVSPELKDLLTNTDLNLGGFLQQFLQL